MTTIDHNGSYSAGTVVGYESYSGTVYGYRLVKEVYVAETGGYHWIANNGKVTNNKFVSTPDNLTILSEKEIKDGYPKKWKPDAEKKKGDILVGKDGEKTMLFVYISDSHVERLTPRSDMGMSIPGDEFGYSSLSDYEGNFGPLTVHELKGSGYHTTAKKFSDL